MMLIKQIPGTCTGQKATGGTTIIAQMVDHLLKWLTVPLSKRLHIHAPVAGATGYMLQRLPPEIEWRVER